MSTGRGGGGHVTKGRFLSISMSIHPRGKGIKIETNLVHTVVECSLSRKNVHFCQFLRNGVKYSIKSLHLTNDYILSWRIQHGIANR
jgi:hypothetical protein